MDRRTQLADAAVTLIGREGLRGLTHRALDRELGVPEGTASNYARTRRELLDLVVGRMAENAIDDAAPIGELPTDPAAAVDVLVAIFERAATRAGENRARFALTVELSTDPELHAPLTHRSQVRAQLLAGAEALLRGLGLPDAGPRANDLLGILNGLLFDRTVGDGLRGEPVDVRNVLTAWLAGISQ